MAESLLRDQKVTVLRIVCPHSVFILPGLFSALPPRNTFEGATRTPSLTLISWPVPESAAVCTVLSFLPQNLAPRDPACFFPPPSLQSGWAGMMGAGCGGGRVVVLASAEKDRAVGCTSLFELQSVAFCEMGAC